VSTDVLFFTCPDCSLKCRWSEKQRALQHQEPTCKTWAAHKGKGHEFMRLALIAARPSSRGGMALGAAGVQERPEAAERAQKELLEQIYEGLKKL